MEAATQPRWRYGHFARAATREAIQPKHAFGGPALGGAFFRGWFTLELWRCPARFSRPAREASRRSVIQHALDGDRLIFWLRDNTCHQRLPLPVAAGDSTVALIAASARSAETVAAV